MGLMLERWQRMRRLSGRDASRLLASGRNDSQDKARRQQHLLSVVCAIAEFLYIPAGFSSITKLFLLGFKWI